MEENVISQGQSYNKNIMSSRQAYSQQPTTTPCGLKKPYVEKKNICPKYFGLRKPFFEVLLSSDQWKYGLLSAAQL